MEFELSGKAGWAGVGFSDDQNMVITSRVRAVSHITSWEPKESRECLKNTVNFRVVINYPVIFVNNIRMVSGILQRQIPNLYISGQITSCWLLLYEFTRCSSLCVSNVEYFTKTH